ncbi:hypothetical protein [Alcanivorax sp. 1008]|uniref:hypothetical protein n=1 Tax=Alcanivorax sp. 1008 TaxID=2816853 RepID=UPI001D48772F|nr:hypothetical protein [Alcanivorax sp. 1008]MCC1496786.1 hypothetical protein [Alcanivorax sp. 1008]
MLTKARAPKTSLDAANKMLEAIQSMLPELEPDVRDAVLAHAELCCSLQDFTQGLDAIRPHLADRFRGRLSELS